jgi:hypothetical protein
MRIEFTLDCCGLERMAMFWQSALGFAVDGIIEGRYVSLSGHGVVLTLQHVAEPKSVKNRMHLDVLVCWPSFLSPMIGTVDVSPVADDGLILRVLSAVVVGFVSVPGSGQSCRRT